jgi:hypothetical protein
MTSRNKFELKEGEPSRTQNVPPGHGPELPTGPDRTSAIPHASGDRTEVATVPIVRTVPGRSRGTGSTWSSPAKRNPRAL